MDFVELFNSVGFPVSCVVGLAWYINKMQKETTAHHMEWREESSKTIAEAREANKELMNANRELLETNRTLAETINHKLDNVENILSKIVGKLNA